MMISVQLVTNASRQRISANDETTIKEFLNNNNVRYENAPVYLDGAPLTRVDYDKSFKDLGITEQCTLTSVVKTENA